MTQVLELINHGVVGVEMRDEEGHGDAAVIGVRETLERLVEVEVVDVDSIVEGDHHELRDLVEWEVSWVFGRGAQTVRQFAVYMLNTFFLSVSGPTCHLQLV